MFNFKTLLRPNIAKHKPYHCTLDDWDYISMRTDLNENYLGPALSSISGQEKSLDLEKYPDFHNTKLKQQLVDFRNAEPNVHLKDGPKLSPENLCLGTGSEDSIDKLMRSVCRPGKDKVLICPPTRSTYSRCASVNDVGVEEVPLTFPDYQVDVEAVLKTVASDPAIKLILIPSPGYPTAKLVNVDSLVELVEAAREQWNGLVVVDEAYVDFVEPVDGHSQSMCTLVNQYDNLVVLHSFSHSFGLAGIRLGVAYCSEEIASTLNAISYPYNIPRVTADLALRSTSPEGIAVMKKNVRTMIEQRDEIIEDLYQIDHFGRIIGGLDANFLLLQAINTKGVPSNSTAKIAIESMAEHDYVLMGYQGSKLNCTGAFIYGFEQDEDKDSLNLALDAGLSDALLDSGPED